MEKKPLHPYFYPGKAIKIFLKEFEVKKIDELANKVNLSRSRFVANIIRAFIKDKK